MPIGGRSEPRSTLTQRELRTQRLRQEMSGRGEGSPKLHFLAKDQAQSSPGLLEEKGLSFDLALGESVSAGLSLDGGRGRSSGGVDRAQDSGGAGLLP